MYRYIDHTADIGIEVEANSLEQLVTEYLEALIKYNWCFGKYSSNSIKICIEDKYPETFFVNLTNTLISESEIRGACYTNFIIHSIDKWIVNLTVFYLEKSKNSIKSANFWNFYYEDYKLRIFLDI